MNQKDPFFFLGEQGLRMRNLEQLLAKYTDSPILHPRVPEGLKPILLENGIFAAQWYPSPVFGFKVPL